MWSSPLPLMIMGIAPPGKRRAAAAPLLVAEGAILIIHSGGGGMNGSLRLGLAVIAAAVIAGGCASTVAGAEQGWGPWMAAPIVSSNPKLGTSLGAMGGILYRFDEQSRVSMFGLSGQYSSTDSYKAALSAKTSFGADRHRAKLALTGGRILNDYQDYLGTGIALKNVETAWGLGGNYLYRFSGNWFAGAQAMFKNYQIVGQTPTDDENLGLLGITGLRSGGVGAVVQNDARDNDNRPTRGWLVNLDNFAFRERLGSDYDYDLYRFDVRGYWGQRGGHVFAARQSNQWTVDAPLEAESSIALRGYKSGQYLGKNVSTVEVEERFNLAKRWGATVFAGLGCLYGDGEACADGDNLYPSYGAGVQFVLVPKEGIVGNLEYGRGKDDNSGVYLRSGTRSDPGFVCKGGRRARCRNSRGSAGLRRKGGDRSPLRSGTLPPR